MGKVEFCPTIKTIRNMTKKELEREGWEDEQNVTCIELDDGMLLYPSRDSEGNGAGKIFGYDPSLKSHFGL